MFVRMCVLALSGLAVSNAAFGDLAVKIDSIIHKPAQKKVDYGIQIVQADTGAVIYSHDAHKPLIPASNMKLITTATALSVLGPDFEFKTLVGISGSKLVIIGSGDPLLGDGENDQKYQRQPGWVIDRIISALKDNGIPSIDGMIIDRGIFESNSVHPRWPRNQLNCWYASEVTGLNYGGNCITVVAKPTKSGAELRTEPETSYITLVNKVRTRGGKVGVWCTREPGTNEIIVTGQPGRVPVSMQLTIDKPAGLFAFLIAESLPKAGIAVSGNLYERQVVRGDKARKIVEFKTPLSDVLARCNKDSMQLAAECLLKTLGAYSSPDKRNGSWANGQAAVAKYLGSLGVAGQEFVIDDGCGLSREDRLSANAITTVLSHMYKSPNWKMYSESLAIGGTDGTIQRYFRQEKYKGRIIGKTGFINGVKSFSGVVSTERGDYLFSILTNHAAGDTRDCINDIVEAIVNANTPPAVVNKSPALGIVASQR